MLPARDAEWTNSRLDEAMRLATPIEAALEEALTVVAQDRDLFVWRCVDHLGPRRGLQFPGCSCAFYDHPPRTAETWNLGICRQVKEARYRVDLVLWIWQGFGGLAKEVEAFLAVECDGHDYHNLTKEQAAHDRSRDRALLIERDLITLRFTGSEIYRDSYRCANEAIDALLGIATNPRRIDGSA